MPLNVDEFQIEDATQEEIAALSPKRQGRGKDPRLVEIVDEVMAGRQKKVSSIDPGKFKGLRISLGRIARERGIRLEYQTEDSTMYIWKSDRPYAQRSPAVQTGRDEPKRRGRPPTQQRQGDVPDAIRDGLSETME